MIRRRRILSFFTALLVIPSLTLTVSASAPSNMVTSTIYVNAGSSRFASVSIQKATTSSTCYMRLRWFKFSTYEENEMPTGKYIYSRLYTDSTTPQMASNNASFNATTSAGQYNYSFLTGYGGLYQLFVLRTNSSSEKAYDVKFDWSPDAYT